MKRKLIYLASPFSSFEDDETARNNEIERRTALAARAASVMMANGFDIFAPIPHSGPIVEAGGNFPHERWMQLDLNILGRCDALVVLKLSGWEKSRGVQQEIAFAALNGIPIWYVGDFPELTRFCVANSPEMPKEVDSPTLTWTSDTPTEPGIYLLKFDIRETPFVVQVHRHQNRPAYTFWHFDPYKEKCFWDTGCSMSTIDEFTDKYWAKIQGEQK